MRLLVRLSVFFHLEDLVASLRRDGKIMLREQSIVADSLTASIDELCQKFGVWAAARTLIYVAWKQRRKSNSVSGLSNRMRQDIGLSPEEDWRLPSRFSAWDIRL